MEKLSLDTHKAKLITAGAGIFMLMRDPGQMVYVGGTIDLRNRFSFWRSTLVKGGGANRPPQFPSTADDTLDNASWHFCIVKAMAGAQREDIRAMEHNVLLAVCKRLGSEGLDKLLNSSVPNDCLRAASPLTPKG